MKRKLTANRRRYTQTHSKKKRGTNSIKILGNLRSAVFIGGSITAFSILTMFYFSSFTGLAEDSKNEIESALYTRQEFFGAEAIVPLPTNEARENLMKIADAQTENPLILEKVAELDERLEKYNEAEIDYRKSIGTNENPFIGNYNLGNAYYQQGKFDDAAHQFENAAGTKSIDKEQQAKSFHNLGNTYVKNKKFDEGVSAYKEALKLNPNDNDTRYNLAYAKSMLQQQQQQKKDDKNKDKNQDKDKKDKDKDKQNQDKQDKDKQEKQKQQEQKQDQAKEDQQKKEQGKKEKISKEDAEKILQALNNEEKKAQKKLNVKQPVKIQIEKEW